MTPIRTSQWPAVVHWHADRTQAVARFRGPCRDGALVVCRGGESFVYVKPKPRPPEPADGTEKPFGYF